MPEQGEGESVGIWTQRTPTLAASHCKRWGSNKSGWCATPPVSEAFLSTSPRVHPSGITRGYAWCVPSGDSEWTMSYFFSYQENKTLGRNVFSHSCGLICCAQKYNKGVSWRNKGVSWQPYCIFKRYKDICAGRYCINTSSWECVAGALQKRRWMRLLSGQIQF